mgnify:CR=1 FL=1
MNVWKNTRRNIGLIETPLVISATSAEPSYSAFTNVDQYLRACPVHNITPMHTNKPFADKMGISQVFFKDESTRHGLGSFKALGGAFAVAQTLLNRARAKSDKVLDFQSLTTPALKKQASAITFVCASAGNHGISVASGAQRFGAKSLIFLSQQVPHAFANKLKMLGASIIKAGNTYEESLHAAKAASVLNNHILLPDAATEAQLEMPRLVMEGYLTVAIETMDTIAKQPTHIFLQGGVGGFAAAMAAAFRHCYGYKPKLVIVEPSKAPCLLESTKAGKPTKAGSEVSNMGRLDCKETSLSALSLLAREADYFVTISDKLALEACALLADNKLPTSPSGAAGFAAAFALCQNSDTRLALEINQHSRVLLFLTEGQVDEKC